MSVVASVHIADVGVGTALGGLRGAPKPRSIAGLRQADVAVAAPLTASVLPAPTLGRVALIAFWDDEGSVDRFEAEHPLAAKLAGGWSARLEPLRAFGGWPGLPDEVPDARTTDYDGPAVVLTLGRLRLSQSVRFLRTSARAEGSAIAAPGFVWGTAMARPPFVGTCSLWESTRSLATYAYGRSDRGHPDAIETDRAKPFHRRSAFVRFRPLAVTGRLEGRNPLPDHALAGG